MSLNIQALSTQAFWSGFLKPQLFKLFLNYTSLDEPI